MSRTGSVPKRKARQIIDAGRNTSSYAKENN